MKRYVWLIVAIALLVGLILDPDGRPVQARTRALPPTSWLATWGASPQAPVRGSAAWRGFDRQTIREIIFTSLGGSWVRVRLTNVFGRRWLSIGAATIAAESRPGLLPSQEVPLSFGGRSSVLVPPGREALSDPARLSVAPLKPLVVSLYLAAPTGPATEHIDAEQVNLIAPGDRVDERGDAGFSPDRAWQFLDAVDVLPVRPELGTLVAFGDSITDGVGSAVGGNDRWPNDLARRLDAVRGASLAVIDEGIAGNRVLHSSRGYGPAAIVRFARDAAGQAGSREVILLQGLNDLGLSQSTSPLSVPHVSVSAAQVIDGYRHLIARAHAAGLVIFGATLTPFQGAWYWTPGAEAKRDAINRWILHSGAFDGVFDFARVLADPADPERLNPAYDSGDHLHPNAAGYLAVANSINLRLLLRDARLVRPGV